MGLEPFKMSFDCCCRDDLFSFRPGNMMIRNRWKHITALSSEGKNKNLNCKLLCIGQVLKKRNPFLSLVSLTPHNQNCIEIEVAIEAVIFVTQINFNLCDKRLVLISHVLITLSQEGLSS